MSAPLVPVMLRLYVPAVDALTISVDVPDPPMIEVELSIAVRPMEEEGESVTVPANPFMGLMVIVDVP